MTFIPVLNINPKTSLDNHNVLRPCVKQSVKALIVTPDGQEVFGSNAINNDVEVCPRVTEGCKTGEGYELCKSVCDQNEHAEVTAIQNAQKAGVNIVGATLYLTGHTYFCDNCTNNMRKAGISKAVCYDSDLVIDFKKEEAID